jgi:hypothetical protein
MTGLDDEPVRDERVAAGDLQVVDRLDDLGDDRPYSVEAKAIIQAGLGGVLATSPSTAGVGLDPCSVERVRKRDRGDLLG